VQNAGETKHFHSYIKENYVDKGKGHLNHQGLYSVIIREKIPLAFPNVDTILWLLLSNKQLMTKVIFAIKAHQE
jgi:hypothetical protein